jgi:nitrogen regulatory protein PII
VKKIILIVKPLRAEAVCRAISDTAGCDVTVTEVRGYGRQKGHLELYHGSEYQITFIPKVRIEAFVRDDQLRECVAAIESAARTGRIGDGKLFVLDARDPEEGF